MNELKKEWQCPSCGKPHGDQKKEFTLSYPDYDKPVIFYRCSCGLIYSEFTLAGKTPDIYNAEFYNFTRYYDDDSRNSIMQHFATFFDETLVKADKKEGTLLDVGCATGDFVSSSLEKGWKAEGIDISQEAVDVGKERGLKLECLSALDLPKTNKKYDIITMWDVIEHTTNPTEIIDSVYDSLNSGGVLLLKTVTSISLIETLARLFYFISFGLVNSPLKRIYVIGHIFYFTEKSLNSLIARDGWKKVNFSKTNTPPNVLFPKNQKILRFLFRIINWMQKRTGLCYEFYIAYQKD